MPTIDLPAGRYLSAPIDVSPDAGGQTRALLMRNRLLVSETGIAPMVLSFSARNDLAERRETLLERRLIVDEIATPNIYEHYREHDWGRSTDAVADPLPVGSFKRCDETYPDGSPWRATYTGSSGKPVYYDYLREDGSPFLRIPKFVFQEPKTWPTCIQQLGRDGQVVGEFGAVGAWFRKWVRELTAGERSFVFIDSRFNAQHLVPMRAPHVHLLYVLHNVHVRAPRHWSSGMTEIYRRLLNRVDGVDAFVTLTDRQRDDIALRRGRTTNLRVCPNPVDMPPDTVDEPRDPHLVVVVARLEAQKRLQDAIAAFALVRAQVPEARFDIYGRGSQTAALQEEIDRLGLTDSVTLKGHHPGARNALSRASAFLMTSSFEGYPLATLESLSHGCPVVSYDIKYGPREQITDGVDGFLVQPRDKETFAARVVQLLTDPELVRTMSAAAVDKARLHDKEHFVRTWRDILAWVIEAKPRRTQLDAVDVEVTALSAGRSIPRRPAAGAGGKLRIEARARVRGDSPASTLDSAEWTLSAVHKPTGWWRDVPLTVRRDGDVFTLRARLRPGRVLDGAPPGTDVRLRLRLVWENSSWETWIRRPTEPSKAVVPDAEDDVLLLQAPPSKK